MRVRRRKSRAIGPTFATTHSYTLGYESPGARFSAAESDGLATQRTPDDLFAQKLGAESAHAQNMGHGVGIPAFRQHGNRNDAADRSTQLTVLAHGIHDFAKQRYVIEFLARL